MNIESGNKMASKNDKMILANEILIVDDEIPNLQLLSEFLGRAGYLVRSAERPQLAIESALAQPPMLILLDVRMPEMDGFEVCKRLKQDECTRGIPIIFICALLDMQDKVLGFEAGGVDFITKPFQEEEVLARVRTHIELRNMQLHLEEMVSDRTAQLHENNEVLKEETSGRKWSVAALLESELRFRATFEQAAVGVAHVTTEGNFLRVNRKFCEIVGYSGDEMRYMNFQEITHPDDLEADLDFVQQLLKGAVEDYSMDKRYRRKDGSIVWVNLTVSLVFDKGGNPKYFVSVIKDISKRKQVEKSFRQNHDFLQHLITSVPDLSSLSSCRSEL